MVDANTLGRESIIIVEIDQDFCSNTYGTLPCTAAVGVTGTFKCYNTLPTCQDPANYTLGTPISLRFSSKSAAFPTGTEAFQYLPFVESVSTSPTEINIGTGNRDMQPLGKRETVTIVMNDYIYDDYLVDNYLADRSANPLSKSTFWNKWLARNLYYQNRPLRVRQGYIGQDVSTMSTRYYFIDQIKGVNSNGKVTITAKDVLSLAEDKRAQAPRASSGVLSADITDSATSLTLLPTGIGDSEYPASGKIVIGKEVIDFTRSSDIFTLTRGVNNTTAKEHKEGDSAQLALVYTDQRIDVVVEDLLVNYGNVDSSYINTSQWTAEADTWLADTNVTTVITEPLGVSQLVSELLEQGTAFIWWDAANQTIPFRAVSPISKDSIIDITSDANIVENSLRITREPKQRLSQIWTYYRQDDPTQSLSQVNNYSGLGVFADLNAEDPQQYNESRVRKIFSRWFKSGNDAQVLVLGSRMIAAFRNNPIYVTFDLDAKDGSIDIADVLKINNSSFIDSQGDNLDTFLQVISRDEIKAGHTVRYKCQIYGFSGRFGYIMPNTANDYLSATEDEINTGSYICGDNGLMSNGTEAYKIA